MSERKNFKGKVSCWRFLTETSDVKDSHVAAAGAKRKCFVDALHDVVEEARVDGLGEGVTRALSLAHFERNPV